MPFPDICVEDQKTCPNEIPTLMFSQFTCGEQTVNLKDIHGKPVVLEDGVHTVCLLAKETNNKRRNDERTEMLRMKGLDWIL